MIIQSKKIYYSSITTGISLVVMLFMAFYALGFVNSNLIVESNSMETLNNLIKLKDLFLSGLIAWVVIIITDLLVTAALYIFLKDINKYQALLCAGFRFIYTIILIVAVSKLFMVYYFINDNPAVTPNLPGDIDGLLIYFNKIWSFGLIVFGAHLLMVGYITYHSKYIPKVLSWLLIIAGVSYSLIHFMNGFIPQMDAITKIIEMILSIPMTIGEIGFGIWLLVKGKNLKQVI